MNPWGFLVILLGIIIVIVGVKGSQHNIAAAITGHAPYVPAAASGNSGTSGGTSPSSGTAHTPSGKPIPIVTSPPLS